METAEHKNHSYLEVGELLRRARESARMPIDQAARMLHIRVRYLDAMEKGNLEELPGLPYARGYLQTYANFLGLDKDEILRRFEEVEKAMAAKNIYFPQVLSKEKSPTTGIIWGSLAAALLAWLVWAIAISSSRESISLVQSFSGGGKGRGLAAAQQDVACLKRQDALYPPCTLVKEPQFTAMPWRGQVISVMELAED